MMRKAIPGVFLLTLFTAAQAQKGEMSVTGGVIYSIPTRMGDPIAYLKNGWGGEIAGVYKFTNNSGVELQANLTRFRYEYYSSDWSVFSAKAGYCFHFWNTGVYLHGLLGPEFDMNIGDPLLTYTWGAGMRFTIKKKHLIDVGADQVFGDTETRINVKLAYGLQWKAKAKTAQPL